jgi:hypothetical protein
MNEVVVSNLTNSLKELISKAYTAHTDLDSGDNSIKMGGDRNATKLQHKNNSANDDDDDSIFLVNLRAIDHQLHQLQVRTDTTSSGNNGSSSSAHNSKNRLMNASTMSPKLDVQALFQKRDMEADRLQLCIQVGR